MSQAGEPQARAVRAGAGGRFFVLLLDRSGTVALAEGDGLRALGVVDGRAPLVGGPAAEVLRSAPPALASAVGRALEGHRPGVVRAVAGLSVRCEPRHDDKGQLLGAVVVGFAAPAPGRTERLELLFRQVPAAIWATDRDLRFTEAVGHAPAMVKTLGVALVGMRLQEWLRTEDPSDMSVAHHLAALAGRSSTFRYERFGHTFETSVHPLRDASGTIIGTVGAGVDVTERQRAEEELTLSRAMLQEAQRVAHIGSWEWDIERDVVVGSAEVFRILGIEEAESGRTLESFFARVHPDDVARLRQVVFDACEKVATFVADHRIVRPDGGVRMLRSSGQVVADERRRPSRMVGSSVDVTERWEATRKLQRTVSLLRATLESTADGVIVVDRDRCIAAHNQRFLALWHVPPEMIRRGDDQAVLRWIVEQLEDPEAFLEKVNDLYARPEAESFDVLHFKDGRVYERYTGPQRLGDEVVGRVWTFRDVTDRERLLRRALFLADAGRLLASLDVEEALGSVARLAVPFMGDGCAIDLLADSDGPRRLVSISRDPSRNISAELPRLVLAGRPLTYAVDGSAYLSVPLLSRAAVLGAMTFVAPARRQFTDFDIEIAEGLAHRAALAVENARLYQQARDAMRAREEFLSIAAHEIRSPLTSIHLAVQGLRDKKLSAGTQARMLEIIEREDRKVARLVDELLDVGRLRTGRLHFELAPVDLAEVAREVASRVGTELARSGSQLSLTTDAQVVGMWDRLRLEQVVLNLLSNAIKFGLGKPIQLVATAGEGKATLRVTDQGVGIAEDAQGRVFQPFERAASSRNYGGLGLGLYIVRTIVEGLGGSVHLESAPGSGTTFTVELPMEKAP